MSEFTFANCCDRCIGVLVEKVYYITFVYRLLNAMAADREDVAATSSHFQRDEDDEDGERSQEGTNRGGAGQVSDDDDKMEEEVGDDDGAVVSSVERDVMAQGIKVW